LNENFKDMPLTEREKLIINVLNTKQQQPAKLDAEHVTAQQILDYKPTKLKKLEHIASE
jgi:hypothetical protein